MVSEVVTVDTAPPQCRVRTGFPAATVMCHAPGPRRVTVPICPAGVWLAYVWFAATTSPAPVAPVGPVERTEVLGECTEVVVVGLLVVVTGGVVVVVELTVGAGLDEREKTSTSSNNGLDQIIQLVLAGHRRSLMEREG